jgi:DGQHR domain-containing protein
LKSRQFSFVAVGARQAKTAKVFTFAALAADVMEMCEISRLGRTEAGQLFGFQRPQIAGHIHEIRDYLQSQEAVLPNAVVVGFLGGVTIKPLSNGLYSLVVTLKHGKPGFVVDGQQRLTALVQSHRTDFEIFVSCVICEDNEELRRQFILINNTRPLPKSLIYELLPEVKALPKRLGSRAFAATLAERLNYAENSSLKGMVFMHTNPSGFIKDTSIQKVIMNSADSGAVREHTISETRLQFGFDLLNNFFAAVQDTFSESWAGHTPRTSRLVHGAGVVAMGYVMETIFSLTGSYQKQDFIEGLRPLKKIAAWTSGEWRFADGGVTKWNEIENTPRQIQKLALHLVAITKRNYKRQSPGTLTRIRRR